MRDVGKTIAWRRRRPSPSSVQTPSDCGIFQSALNVARRLPDASGTGRVSMPAPVVICTGVPPATGTAQMWRRSMSFAFVQ